jgi:ceramide glucosyltransferase
VIATAAGLALFVWAYSVGCTSLYGAARAALQRRRAPAPAVSRRARALVVRPCAGLEPDLDRALTSLSRARCTAEIACRLAVESPSDPAARAATAAAAALRAAGIDASVVFTSAAAPNHKAAQIAAVLAREPHPFDALVVADSDVDLEGFDLDTLVAPLFQGEAGEERSPQQRERSPQQRERSPQQRERSPRPGAVWAPPVEAGLLTASGDRASHALLGGSLHAFTILGALDGRGLVGKLCAVRRDALDAAGGFGAMERVLGEDMELSQRLTSADRTVTVAPAVARSLKTGRTWQSAVDRYARWLTVIRAQRPHLLASYPLLFFAAPLLLVASLLLAPFAKEYALATATITISSRLVAALSARALAGFRLSLREAVIDAALSDALLAHAFVRAMATRTVTWRGRTLSIDRRGMLYEGA